MQIVLIKKKQCILGGMVWGLLGMCVLRAMNTRSDQVLTCVPSLQNLALPIVAQSMRNIVYMSDLGNYCRVWKALNSYGNLLFKQMPPSLHTMLDVLVGGFACVKTVQYPELLSTAIIDEKRKLLISVGDSGNIYIGQMNQRGPIEKIAITSNRAAIRSLQMTADGKYLVCGSVDGQLCLWDMDKKQLIIAIASKHGCIESLAFVRKDTILISAGHDGRIRLWDLTQLTSDGFVAYITELIITRQSADSTKLPDNFIRSILVTNDNRMLVVAVGGAIMLLDITDIRKVKTLATIETISDAGITNLILMCNQKTLISASSDASIKIWDISDVHKPVSIVSVLHGHGGTVNAIKLMFNDTILVSTGADNTIKVWDISSLSQPFCIFTLHGHTNWIRALLTDSRGEYLISACADKTVKIWSPSTLSYALFTRMISRMAAQLDVELLYQGNNSVCMRGLCTNERLNELCAAIAKPNDKIEGPPSMEDMVCKQLHPHELESLLGCYKCLLNKFSKKVILGQSLKEKSFDGLLGNFFELFL